jgi:hypothetical protein
MKKDYMCVYGKMQVMDQIKKAEEVDDVSSDLFFSTDCRVLYKGTAKRSAILVATRNFF